VKAKRLSLNEEGVFKFEMNCMDGKGVRNSNVRIDHALRTFKREGQTIEFEMNDIYSVTKG